LNRPVSSIAGMAHILMAVLAKRYISLFDNQFHALGSIILMQGVSWFMQVVVGHWILEKNQPSMTKKLTFNSIVLSVLLAWDK